MCNDSTVETTILERPNGDEQCYCLSAGSFVLENWNERYPDVYLARAEILPDMGARPYCP